MFAALCFMFCVKHLKLSVAKFSNTDILLLPCFKETKHRIHIQICFSNFYFVRIVRLGTHYTFFLPDFSPCCQLGKVCVNLYCGQHAGEIITKIRFYERRWKLVYSFAVKLFCLHIFKVDKVRLYTDYRWVRLRHYISCEQTWKKWLYLILTNIMNVNAQQHWAEYKLSLN